MTKPVNERNRTTWRMTRRWGPTAAAVLCMVAAAGFFVAGQQRTDGEKQEAQATASTAVKQKDQALEATEPVCDRPQLDAELTRMCAELQEARERPDPVPAEQVDYQLVRSYVDDALDQDPRLSESALLALVQQVYAQNPPADGKTPTPAELLALIRQVYAENPPADGVDGTNGTNGRDGQNAFCFDNPTAPECQPKQGPQGVSVVGFGFERTEDGQCVLAQVLENPVDGARQTIRLPIPDQLCQESDPPEDPPADPPENGPGGLLPGG